jgi:peptidoglycan/LPS O-acetylase OafA/YrhL
MNLGKAFNSTQNSFTFIRLFLAIIVVLSHTYELGGYGPDPLKSINHVSLGDIAVDCFFAISGFLITKSYLSNSSISSYLVKRSLRIFPGYWSCLLITSFILCPVLYFIQYKSFESIGTFLDNPFTNYVKSNFALHIRQANIAGLFQNHPRDSLNGALWSLFPEFICYLSIILLGVTKLLGKRKILLALFFILLVVHISEEYVLYYLQNEPGYMRAWTLYRMIRVYDFFLAGCLLFLYRSEIPFSRKSTILFVIFFIFSLLFDIYKWCGPIIVPPIQR